MKRMIILVLLAGLLIDCGKAIQSEHSHELAVKKNNEALYEMIKNDSASMLLALDLLNQAISADSNFVTAYHNKLKCLCNLNRIEEAIGIAELIVIKQPQNVEALVMWGMLVEKAGKKNYTDIYNEALTKYNNKIVLESDDPLMHLNKAFLLLMMEKQRGLDLYEDLRIKFGDAIDSTYWDPIFYDFNKIAYLEKMCQ
jgi:tetratricopeptide (TPR) repeat protein